MMRILFADIYAQKRCAAVLTRPSQNSMSASPGPWGSCDFKRRQVNKMGMCFDYYFCARHRGGGFTHFTAFQTTTDRISYAKREGKKQMTAIHLRCPSWEERVAKNEKESKVLRTFGESSDIRLVDWLVVFRKKKKINVKQQLSNIRSVIRERPQCQKQMKTVVF